MRHLGELQRGPVMGIVSVSSWLSHSMQAELDARNRKSSTI